MDNKYKMLSFQDIDRNTSVYRPLHMVPNSVLQNDPAILVMTDLKRVTPLSIQATANIEAANQKMISCGVRLLFVDDDQGVFAGLITSEDILGEKPVLYMNEHGGRREEILVRDIMQRRDTLDAVSIDDVARASVGDIAETLRHARRQHVLVCEKSVNGNTLVRGIFSSTQIERQLGESIAHTERAKSFAELEQAIMATV